MEPKLGIKVEMPQTPKKKIINNKWHINPHKSYLVLKNYFAKRQRKSSINRREMQRILLDYVYYWGFYPISYDKSENKFVVNFSKCWLFSTILIFVPKFLVIFALFRTVSRDGLKLTKISDLFPLYFTGVSVLTILLQLHATWKRHEIAALINTYNFTFDHGKCVQ